MVSREVEGEPGLEREVTPMTEIRRRKSITVDEFNRRYPEYEWTEGRKGILLRDDHGGLWVPLVDPLHGLYYEFDDPELTPEIEEALLELAREAREGIKAGRYYTLDDLDAEDGIAE